MALDVRKKAASGASHFIPGKYMKLPIG